MKKIVMLVLATLSVAILATSCCNCDKDGKCCKKEGKEFPQGPNGECPGMPGKPMPNGGPEMGCPEMKACHEKMAKFDSLSVDEQKAFLKEMKENIDKREAEMAAKKAEMDAKWANFDNLSVEEQKELVMMKCPGKKPGECHKDGKFDGPRPEGGHHGGPRPEAPGRPDKK